MDRKYDLEDITDFLAGFNNPITANLSNRFLEEAGERADYILGRALEVLDDEWIAIKWLYSPCKDLYEQTPFEFCMYGNDSEVERVLGRIEEGIF